MKHFSFLLQKLRNKILIKWIFDKIRQINFKFYFTLSGTKKIIKYLLKILTDFYYLYIIIYVVLKGQNSEETEVAKWEK